MTSLAMMIHGFLLVLLTGLASALPPQVDEAMITLGQSDMHLNEFFDALARKAFNKLPELYSKVTAAITKLEHAVAQLQKTRIPKNLQVIVRLLDIQLNTVIYKIRGVIPGSDHTQKHESGRDKVHQKRSKTHKSSQPHGLPTDYPVSDIDPSTGVPGNEEFGNDEQLKLNNQAKLYGQRNVHHFRRLY